MSGWGDEVAGRGAPRSDAGRRDSRRRDGVAGRGLGRALSWLYFRHGEELAQAIGRGFFGSLTARLWRRLGELPEVLRQMIEINANEWLLAEVELVAEGAPPRRALRLLGEPGAPLLDARARVWIAEMSRRPLRLYEVVAVRHGRDVGLRDLLAPSPAALVWIGERCLARGFVAGDVLGLRLLWVDGRWQASGATYPFERSAAGVAAAREVLSGVARLRQLRQEKIDQHISLLIAHRWLEALAAWGLHPAGPPAQVDA